nr:hypothetical protein [Deltaproteobacteria bacterium]
MALTYQHAGVDITLGDEASRILYDAARQTWANRSGRLGEVITPFDDFSGIRTINVGGLPPGTIMGIGFDGVGTKVEIAERTGRHDTLAFDLLAMVCDDAVVRGGEPVLAGSVLDVNSLGSSGEDHLDCIRQLAEGYIAAAKEAGVAIINGELAELGSRVGGYGRFNYSWSAGVIWFARKERMFSGFEINPGDTLVGLREEGFRSNGLSLVRRILSDRFGTEWHTRSDGETSYGELALKPSRIYSRAVIAMFGGVEGEPAARVHGVAHITGGGLPGKLGRILKPKNLGASIDQPLTPGQFVLFCQEAGEVSDAEAYRTWNMGQGMVIITPEPEAVIAIARSHALDAAVIGTVTAKPGITITSAGAFQKGTSLAF